MNPEELFEKLMQNKITQEEFEKLLEGFEDEEILARYETFLQEQFEKEVEAHFSKEEKEEAKEAPMKVIKKYKRDDKEKNQRKGNRDFPIAAVLIFFIGLVFSVMFIISQMDQSSGTAQNNLAEITPDMISKSTPKGRRFKMSLQDGSFVHMNSASKITYPNIFDGDSREIEMEGELYFDIAHDKERPFRINVKGYQIEVLGTSFGVTAYEGEDDFEVVVESGKVKVILDEGENSTILEKDQKLIFNPKTNLTEIVEVMSGSDLKWRKGILSFDSTPMKKVERMVENWYGIDLVIANPSIYKKSFNGDHHNESLKSVLEVIKTVTGAEYVVEGKSIILNM